eukprot:GDKI01013014.1.p1 GENE.GDKI01013014.1~~GDKI01013014.1.p1  ORF type:complete len:327 (-),score=69.36 GDKI01013014.1:352-1332(-)
MAGNIPLPSHDDEIYFALPNELAAAEIPVEKIGENAADAAAKTSLLGTIGYAALQGTMNLSLFIAHMFLFFGFFLLYGVVVVVIPLMGERFAMFAPFIIFFLYTAIIYTGYFSLPVCVWVCAQSCLIATANIYLEVWLHKLLGIDMGQGATNICVWKVVVSGCIIAVFDVLALYFTCQQLSVLPFISPQAMAFYGMLAANVLATVQAYFEYTHHTNLPPACYDHWQHDDGRNQVGQALAIFNAPILILMGWLVGKGFQQIILTACKGCAVGSGGGVVVALMTVILPFVLRACINALISMLERYGDLFGGDDPEGSDVMGLGFLRKH